MKDASTLSGTKYTYGVNMKGGKTHSHVDNATLEDLRARHERGQSVCKALRLKEINVTHTGHVQGVFVNQGHKLAYCFVPKTGCTFWKQVFSFLNNVTHLKTPVSSPFDIPRLLVHRLPNAYGVDWNGVKKSVLRDHLRFMFARDPYSRLWSAYLDKFYLPDFWTLFSGRILSRRSPKPGKDVLTCGMNVSFAEFVDFALDFNEPHWTPVASSCDPCKFLPEVIGKMETYTRDAKVVLGRAGLGWILEGVDHHKHVQNELEMLIQYNFEVIHTKSPVLADKCISDEALGARLWTTFQDNGYIPGDLAYSPSSPFTQGAFKDRVLEAFNKSEAYGKGRLKDQKRTAMENAFKQLPRETLQRIAERYVVDFKMFDYKPRYFV
ncbi:hypothetical protein V1264_000662 [Littorina saxatilis]|uniref:Carbohydrate sulfotransferase n=1 Tax=Littorina saxatilis TaxID=31220 RepID=A0AAN9GN21_9CAEN